MSPTTSTASPKPAATAPRRVFLTGGSGFLGRVVAANLQAAGHHLTLLTRDRARVPAAIAQRSNSSTTLVQGTLDDPASYAAALDGADVVVHAAKSDDADPRRRAQRDIDATATLLQRSIDQGVRRIVFVSSISVYDVPAAGVVNETSPRTASDDPYAMSKVQAERIVLDRRGSIEVVVLQPANIYGPGPCWWSGSILDMMRHGRIILVNDGEGTSNMVHVNDVAQAVRLAIDCPTAAGETFLITDGQPIPWRRYFEMLEALIGRSASLPLSRMEAMAMSRRLSDRSFGARAMRWLRRRLLGEPLVFPLSDGAIDKYAAKAVFDISKARQLLGYEPRYDLAAGVATLSRDA
jgi:nucleoside-diphosphate-sugar epimerase